MTPRPVPIIFSRQSHKPKWKICNQNIYICVCSVSSSSAIVIDSKNIPMGINLVLLELLELPALRPYKISVVISGMSDSIDDQTQQQAL